MRCSDATIFNMISFLSYRYGILSLSAYPPLPLVGSGKDLRIDLSSDHIANLRFIQRHLLLPGILGAVRGGAAFAAGLVIPQANRSQSGDRKSAIAAKFSRSQFGFVDQVSANRLRKPITVGHT